MPNWSAHIDSAADHWPFEGENPSSLQLQLRREALEKRHREIEQRSREISARHDREEYEREQIRRGSGNAPHHRSGGVYYGHGESGTKRTPLYKKGEQLT